MTTRPTLCVLAPVHPYYDIRVFQKEAKALARAGYRVIVYAKADGPKQEEGVAVHPLSYSGRLQRFMLQPYFLWLMLRSGAKLFHLHNPDTIPIGLALKLCGKRVVYDTHEHYRMLTEDKEWIPKPLRKPLAIAVDGLERLANRTFDKMVVTRPELVDHFGGGPMVVANPPITTGPLIDQARELSKQRQREDFLRLICIGLVKEDRGLYLMVEALEQLNRTTPARLWLMGPPGSDELIPRAEKMPGWKYVDYLGIVPQAEAFSYFAVSDASLAIYHPWGDNAHVNPNKLFEPLLFGKPVIASDFAAWRRDLAGVDCAVWVDQSNMQSIVDGMRWVAEHPDEARKMGEIGQRFVTEDYNWEKESQKLIELYDRLSTE